MNCEIPDLEGLWTSGIFFNIEYAHFQEITDGYSNICEYPNRTVGIQGIKKYHSKKPYEHKANVEVLCGYF